MDFEVYTQDGFTNKGKKRFETLEELMAFIKLNAPHGVTVYKDELYVLNMGDEDRF